VSNASSWEQRSCGPHTQGKPHVVVIGLLVSVPGELREGIKAFCGSNLPDCSRGDEAGGDRGRHGLFVSVWADDELADMAGDVRAALEHGEGAFALLEGVQGDCLVKDGGYMGVDVAVLCGC